MFCRLLCALACVLACARAAAPDPARFAQVQIEPSKTSIYLGVVSLTLPVFQRASARYESSYSAKVMPYFFLNEKGRISVDVSDEALAKLARGEAIEFTGRAVREDGVERRVEGKATPADATGGKVKVRVFVTKSVELIFNSTYRLDPKPAANRN
ncbi:MAG: hypothetical protein HZA93_21030 [Verrucomicrobia bacterium]|nr:hypothetical protein [Verrucomicrobiota bacterium]